MIGHRWVSGALGACALAVAIAEPVRAQTPAPAPAKSRSLTEELEGPALAAFEQGRDLFEHQDYVTAHAKFRAAYQASKNARLLWNMAACSSKQKRYAQAIAEAERYLAEGQGRLAPEAVERAQAFVAEVRSYVAEATVSVEPESADLFVDDEPRAQGARRATLLLELGRHAIRAERQGFEPLVESVVVRDVGKLSVALVLRPVAPAAAPAPVSLPPSPVSLPSSPLAAPAAAETERASWWPWAVGGAALAAGVGLAAYYLFTPTTIRESYALGTAAHFEVR